MCLMIIVTKCNICLCALLFINISDVIDFLVWLTLVKVKVRKGPVTVKSLFDWALELCYQIVGCEAKSSLGQ